MQYGIHKGMTEGLFSENIPRWSFICTRLQFGHLLLSRSRKQLEMLSVLQRTQQCPANEHSSVLPMNEHLRAHARRVFQTPVIHAVRVQAQARVHAMLLKPGPAGCPLQRWVRRSTASSGRKLTTVDGVESSRTVNDLTARLAVLERVDRC
jgi:hypothetical protein